MSLLFEGTANTTMHVNTTGQLPVLAIIAAETSVHVLPHSQTLLKGASPLRGEFLTQVCFYFTSLRMEYCVEHVGGNRNRTSRGDAFKIWKNRPTAK